MVVAAAQPVVAARAPGPAAEAARASRSTPVKVSQGRSWGPIALFTAVGVIAAAIIGYGVYAVSVGPKD